MAEPKRTSAKIDTAARERLSELCMEVRREFGIPATREAIVSALILDITVPQVAGILLGYYKRTATTSPLEDESA
jgi:hypothetical protein